VIAGDGMNKVDEAYKLPFEFIIILCSTMYWLPPLFSWHDINPEGRNPWVSTIPLNIGEL